MTSEDRSAVDVLVEQLKTLPLIDNADLDRPFAAYQAFELVASAILRAALVLVPRSKRDRQNGAHFRDFVVRRFPPGHGRGDPVYAGKLWKFRSAFLKDEQTPGFVLIHNTPAVHRLPAADGREVLNLDTLIADFRAAVDDLGVEMKADPRLQEIASTEVARRTVHITPLHNASEEVLPHTSGSLTGTVTIARLSANALSGTK